MVQKLIIFFTLGFILLSLAACVAGPNDLINTVGTRAVAGFWKGLWHGFISLFTFIISLFRDNVNIYEVHNNGGWYNFGFILGVMCFYGGSKEGHTKARARKRD
ncbi:MAG: hypothetical protein KAK01_08025 [Candidatus Marinimicrobia bacterium]|nr:hypothetical protein [Candidatus Neomarinimicrobiota bacterium]